MKLLTLNTHSLIEKNYEQKLVYFVSATVKECPDIIALQESNQSDGNIVKPDGYYFPSGSDIPIRESNHSYRAARLLRDMGAEYFWTWLPIKKGYGSLDEGLSFLSRFPIVKSDALLMSNSSDYQNWKTRKALTIQTSNKELGVFYNVHMGWWNDADEPFINHWKRLRLHTENKNRVWLMGDFNAPADTKNEGYDAVCRSGFYDTFAIAQNHDDGYTVIKEIDGWRETENKSQNMRIDYIWCNNKENIESSKVIFNGINYPVVSDHFGVIVKTKE